MSGQKDTYIYGCGGFGRELCLLLEDINQDDNRFNIIGFLDDDKAKHGSQIIDYPVLGGLAYCESLSSDSNVLVAIGNPEYKKPIIEKLSTSSNISFPNVIHPTAKLSRTVNLGVGNIIFDGALLSCSATLGDHCFVSYNAIIGHDSTLADFSLVSPRATVCGHVDVGEGVVIGAGASISNGSLSSSIVLGEYSIVGLGASVINSIDPYVTVLGNPASPVFKRKPR